MPQPPALLRNPWLKGVAATLMSRGLMIAIGLVSTVILARSLGPAGRGAYAAAVSTSLVGVVIGTLGYHVANPYYLAQDPESLGALTANGLALSILAGLIAAVVALAVWLVDPAILPVGGALAVLVVAWIPAGVAFTQLQPMELTLGRVGRFNVVEAGWQIAGTALIVLLWLVHHITTTSAFAVSLAAFGTATVYLVIDLTQRGYGLRPSWPLLVRTFPYAGRSYLTSVTGLLLVRLDILVVNGMLGARQAGYYSIDAAVGEMFMLLPATVGTLLFPRLTALRTRPEQLALARRVAVITGGILSTIALITAVAAPLGVRLLYGSAYLPAVTAIRWTLPGLVLFGVNTILVFYFLAIGVPRWIVVGQAAAVVVNIGFDVFFLDDLKMVAAGLASTLAYATVLASNLVYLWLNDN